MIATHFFVGRCVLYSKSLIGKGFRERMCTCLVCYVMTNKLEKTNLVKGIDKSKKDNIIDSRT